MLKYLLLLLFLICTALAAGGILLSVQLRKRWNKDFFSALLYHTVFLSMFGFYALWGQFASNIFLAEYLSPQLFSKVTDLTILLGSPFMVVGWLMLLRFASEFSGKKIPVAATALFLVGNLAALLLISFLPGYITGYAFLWLFRLYFASASLLFTCLALLRLLSKKSLLSGNRDRLILAAAMAGLMVAESLLVFFYTGALWQSMLFILLFFAGIAFLPVYLHYLADLREGALPGLPRPGFGEFCVRYEISARERDIIREICNGHSNQEIADKLFISLQTVKDHTHRIYSKVDIKSRVQLIKLVGEIKE